MAKKFTNAQFSAMTNEFVRLAKKFSNKGFDSSVTFMKDNFTLYIHDEVRCVCILTLRRDRYVSRNEIKELEDVALRADISLDGRYVTIMRDAIKDNTTDNIYIEF